VKLKISGVCWRFSSKELGKRKKQLVIRSQTPEIQARGTPSHPRLKELFTKVFLAIVARIKTGMQ
jgi:hypothetical protein